MKIKRLKNFENDDYIQLGDFESTIEVNSPTYGKYLMTEVLIVDLIKACEDKKLLSVFNRWSELRRELLTLRSIKIDSKEFGTQSLQKFKVYVPLTFNNTNWVANKDCFEDGKLPVAFTKNYVMRKINNIL